MPKAPRNPGTGPSPFHGRVVTPSGPKSSPVLIIGERPGVVEAQTGMPFQGPTGREQATYLRKGGMEVYHARLVNVVWDFADDNPDPKPADLARWEQVTLNETANPCRKLIIAVGRFAMRWFLGDDAELDVCRGIPHRAGAFDPTRANRAPVDCVIVPVTHPAAGLHNPDIRAQIMDDYERATTVWKALKGSLKSAVQVARLFREDVYAEKELYKDVTGAQLQIEVQGSFARGEGDWEDNVIALDTEGSVEDPWAVQVSMVPGTGFTLRRSQPDFAVGIDYLQMLADNGYTFVMHAAHTPSGTCWDIKVCRALGLNLTRAKIADTMFAAWLLRLEPRGLKALAYRWCGMEMVDYQKVLGNVAEAKQIDYLCAITDREWPAVEQQIKHSNDGTFKMYKPKHIVTRVKKILTDWTDPLTNTEEKPVELHKRWKAIDDVQRRNVERELGPFPHATLDDVPLDTAIRYASRDPDATLRVYHALMDELKRKGLSRTFAQSMDVLPVLEEMEHGGIPADPSAFQALNDELDASCDALCHKISNRYWGGKPFNPKSTRHVTQLMLREGVEGAKRTKLGKISTGKQAIEHLRYENEAIADVIEWREKQHIRDMYCVPTLEMLEEQGVDARATLIDIHTKLNPMGTTTRRLASNDPNLLAFPKHEKPGGNDYGKRIRACFVAPPGWLYLECDLSQIELRMFAHESGDTTMCRAYIEGRDLHAETAARLFNVPDALAKDKAYWKAEPGATQRFFAKKVNFGIPYGTSGPGMADQIRVMGIDGFDADVCTAAIKDWHKLYKGGSKYIADVERETANTGMVRDCWGMIRYLPAVWSYDPKEASEAKRQAVNHRIQGGAQGCLQQSITWLRPRVWDLQDTGVGVRWVLTIHDSLLLLVREEHVDGVEAMVIDAMENHNGIKLKVPVRADAKSAKTWGEL